MYIFENQVAISTKFTISQLNRYFVRIIRDVASRRGNNQNSSESN